MFVHDLVELKELDAVTEEGRRVYKTPNGDYPSVTTVLGSQSKEFLDAWRERLGEEEATRQAFQAATRGSATHNMAEQYIRNNPDYKKGYSYFEKDLFNRIKPVLDNRVGKIRAIEAPLYSDMLKVAGRVDLIAEFDNVLSIIDFKTSNKEKKKDWIKSYFMQCSAYALMFYELTGILISRIVIIIVSETVNGFSSGNGDATVYIENPAKYITEFKAIRNDFKKEYGY